MKYLYTGIILFLLAGCSKTDSLSGAGAGTGGSMARFTISHGHLYVVDGNSLHTFMLQNDGKPVAKGTFNLSFNGEVETIYPWKDRLYIGTMSAMHVISIEEPSNPYLVGTASHARACDPVVANDDYAYVTVRSGSTCGGTVNSLQVFDVRGSSPALKATINMYNPHGLGLYNNHLYVCDEREGLIVFDVTNGSAPEKLKTLTGYTFLDCIPIDDVLITMVNNGMVLYDISNPGSPELLSEILN